MAWLWRLNLYQETCYTPLEQSILSFRCFHDLQNTFGEALTVRRLIPFFSPLVAVSAEPFPWYSQRLTIDLTVVGSVGLGAVLKHTLWTELFMISHAAMSMTMPKVDESDLTMLCLFPGVKMEVEKIKGSNTHGRI